MSDHEIRAELAAVADEAEAGRDDAPGTRVRSTRPPRDPSQVYSIRIPVDRLEDLRTLAAERRAAPSTLMRQWVLDRLDQEQSRSRRGVVHGGLVEAVAIVWDPNLARMSALTPMLRSAFHGMEGCD